MIQVGIERYIRGYQYRPKTFRSVWLEARAGEKIAVRLYKKTKTEDGLTAISPGDKVISGIIMDIGSKIITLKTGPYLQGERIGYLNTERIRIEDIETFAKFPKGYQEYKTYKLY
jgi:hypothetical protein